MKKSIEEIFDKTDAVMLEGLTDGIKEEKPDKGTAKRLRSRIIGAEAAEAARRSAKRRRFSLAAAVCLVLAAAVVIAAVIGSGSAKDGDRAEASEKQRDYAPHGGEQAEACYNDRSRVRSFTECDSKAAYIVRARVTEVEVIVGQRATMTVTHVYRGEVPDTIYLLQFPEDNGVSKGYEYLLFLGEQHREDVDTGCYSPLGPAVGAIRLHESTKTMYLYNDSIYDKDFAVWLIKNGFGDWTVKFG